MNYILIKFQFQKHVKDMKKNKEETMKIELNNYHKFYKEYKELEKKYKCGIAVTQNGINSEVCYSVIDDESRKVYQFKKQKMN